MLKALVYAYVNCPACGESSLPLKAWIVESGYDEEGHAEGIEIETIECCQCSVLEYDEDDALEEKLEKLADDILEAVYSGQAYPIGEILSYYPPRS